MRRFGLVFAALCAFGMVGCGGGGAGDATLSADHAVCKDAVSASEYVQKVSAEIAQAATAGKVTPEQAQKAGDKMRAEMNAGVGENAPERGVGYMCNVMDGLKKELGI